MQGPGPRGLSGLAVEEADGGGGADGQSMGQAVVRAQEPEPLLLQGTRCRWRHQCVCLRSRLSSQRKWLGSFVMCHLLIILAVSAEGQTDLWGGHSAGAVCHLPSTVSSRISETIEYLFFKVCIDVSYGTVTMHKKF